MSAFDESPRSAARHYELYFYAAIMRLRAGLPGLDGAVRESIAPFAFLQAYFAEIAAAGGLQTDAEIARWYAFIERWEDATTGHLPLRHLRLAGTVDHDALTALALVGLVDEDSRFGPLFDSLRGGAGARPTGGLIADLWETSEARRGVRRAIERLLSLGLIEANGITASPADSALHPAGDTWSVVRGDGPPHGEWFRYGEPQLGLTLSDLVMGPAAERASSAAVAGVRSRALRTIVVRGPGRSGRKALLQAVASELGLGALTMRFARLDDTRWRSLGTLAVALRAMPIVAIDGASEITELPDLPGYSGPVGIAMSLLGSLRGPLAENAATIRLGIPDAGARRRMWHLALPDRWGQAADAAADRHRMTTGNIYRVARSALSRAVLDGRTSIDVEDVLEAGRNVRDSALEPLATRVETSGDWLDLVVHGDVTSELELLEQRCRSRERLIEVLDGPVALRSAGVRVIFTGASGTGKTLAARILASRLAMDLYSVDVGRIVDKYLGETEKNLTAVFARAAELDAMLLVDEGDSLLTGRTDVRTSNDRYANLQTNHLLQLLETHDGIVVITSNAADRIDAAFQRRLDVVIEFRLPDAALRWELWRHHLPAAHEVSDDALSEIASRCALTGGQIRNAVLHSWLLALRRGSTVVPDTADVEAAVRREYQKLGSTCPLPPTGLA